jgi:tRNA-dihydrouridine synthase A
MIKKSGRRISVAPMMDWTDRHCRFFHRQLSKDAWLYTEMVTTGALLHGNVERHLRFNEVEHPLALQLGGSDPHELAQSAKLGELWGYDEVNLNCGCPSERVQKGAFGACLMREPELVAECVKAMRDSVSIDVTVKHRIGVDHIESYDFVRDFVGIVSQAGCYTFIVHARNAILKGLSPKDNREIPPLKYDWVYQLKKDFSHLEFILNGGVTSFDEIDRHLPLVDGVMLGRWAYHDPYCLSQVDARYYGELPKMVSRKEVIDTMVEYAKDQLEQFGTMGGGGLRLNSITRHMLGLMAGVPGARAFRRVLSDASFLKKNDPEVLRLALEKMAE